MKKYNRPPERQRSEFATAEDFARYVAFDYYHVNRDFLLAAVKKNITLDEPLLEETYHETMLTVYRALSARDADVASLADYCFLALKYNYIAAQTRSRRDRQRFAPVSAALSIPDDSGAWIASEQRAQASTELISEMYDELLSVFPDSPNADMWLIYNRLKSEKPSSVSYQKLAALYGFPPGDVARRIQLCNEHIRGRKAEYGDRLRRIIASKPAF